MSQYSACKGYTLKKPTNLEISVKSHYRLIHISKSVIARRLKLCHDIEDVRVL